MESQTFTFPANGNAQAKQVAHYLGVHINTVWRYAKCPDFPEPHQLTDGMTVFDAAAIRQWNRQKTRGGNA